MPTDLEQNLQRQMNNPRNVLITNPAVDSGDRVAFLNLGDFHEQEKVAANEGILADWKKKRIIKSYVVKDSEESIAKLRSDEMTPLQQAIYREEILEDLRGELEGNRPADIFDGNPNVAPYYYACVVFNLKDPHHKFQVLLAAPLQIKRTIELGDDGCLVIDGNDRKSVDMGSKRKDDSGNKVLEILRILIEDWKDEPKKGVRFGASGGVAVATLMEASHSSRSAVLGTVKRLRRRLQEKGLPIEVKTTKKFGGKAWLAVTLVA